MIAISSASTFPTGEAHWEPLIRARAIENPAYVIAPAQFGPNLYGYSDYSNSMIVDPWDRVLARVADPKGVMVAPIDLQAVPGPRADRTAGAETRAVTSRDRIAPTIIEHRREASRSRHQEDRVSVRGNLFVA